MALFRIHFFPEAANWEIQVREWAWFWPRAWQSVRTNPGGYPMRFKSFDEAYEYAKSIGLDKAYRHMGQRPWDKVKQGGV